MDEVTSFLGNAKALPQRLQEGFVEQLTRFELVPHTHESRAFAGPADRHGAPPQTPALRATDEVTILF